MSCWIAFEDKLPPSGARILFKRKGWAIEVYGIFGTFEDLPWQKRLCEYDRDNDRLMIWDSMLPSHYMLIPELP
jgi:hypothetical protein